MDKKNDLCGDLNELENFLLGDLLCTICYEGDYEIENARKNIREILKNGIEGEFERRK